MFTFKQQRRASLVDIAMSVSLQSDSDSVSIEAKTVITTQQDMDVTQDLAKTCSANEAYKLFIESIKMALQIDGEDKVAISGILRVIGRSYRKMLVDKTKGIPLDARMRALIREAYESAITVNENNQLARIELQYFKDTHMANEKRTGVEFFRMPIFEYKKEISNNKAFLFEFLRDHFIQLDVLDFPSNIIIPELLYRIGKEYEAGSVRCVNKDDVRVPNKLLFDIFTLDAAKLGHTEAQEEIDKRRGPGRACLYG